MIIITGASQGLGSELAKLYKTAGKTVVNISRSQCEYADHNLLFDLQKGSEIAEAVQQVGQLEEPIEAIIYSAGVLSIAPLADITEDEVMRLMTTNVNSQILLTSRLANRIKKDKTDLVCVSSTVGTKAYADQAVYGASKWAVRGFAQNLQVEFKNLPNRVISFCPGGFISTIFEKATGEHQELDPKAWMDPKDVAVFIKQILDLPKTMEVSEVIVNRKAI